MCNRHASWCTYSIYCFFCTAIFFVCSSGVIFWLIFRPQELKFTVTDSSLTKFDFNPTNSTLSYNLAFNVSIRNPNKRVGVYYTRIQALTIYSGKKFAMVTRDPFYQGHKNTSFLMPVLEGDVIVPFGKREIQKYEAEKSSGVFSIQVDLKFKIRPKYGKIKIGNYKPPAVECQLEVPLSSGERGFKPTSCRNVYFLRSKTRGG